RTGHQGAVHGYRLRARLPDRPPLAAGVEVEPRHLHRRTRLRWAAAAGVAGQRCDRALERYAVVRLERRGLAVAHMTVGALDAEEEQLALGHHSRGCGVGLAERERQAQEAARHDNSSAAARRSENTATSRPVSASARLSDGPSERVYTVRTR